MFENEYLLQTRSDTVKGLEMEVLKDEPQKINDRESRISCLGKYASIRLIMTLYLVISIGFNIKILSNMTEVSFDYHILGMLATIMGFLGILSMNINLIFFYESYLVVSFIYSSFVGIIYSLIIFNSKVCQSIERTFPEKEVANFCLADPLRFKVIIAGIILSELFMEVCVLHMTNSMYVYAFSKKSHIKNAKMTLRKGEHLKSIATIET